MVQSGLPLKQEPHPSGRRGCQKMAFPAGGTVGLFIKFNAFISLNHQLIVLSHQTFLLSKKFDLLSINSMLS
ncbi:hypothetical protein DK749_24860 [Salmonella enterica subsp. salamae]|nr:hypothetical protein [Salmonella enterica subsp. enterica serovar Kouka]ECE5745823.1 hypothetical protein [Salmonella enterica subsp. salamae]